MCYDAKWLMSARKLMHMELLDYWPLILLNIWTSSVPVNHGTTSFSSCFSS